MIFLKKMLPFIMASILLTVLNSAGCNEDNNSSLDPCVDGDDFNIQNVPDLTLEPNLWFANEINQNLVKAVQGSKLGEYFDSTSTDVVNNNVVLDLKFVEKIFVNNQSMFVFVYNGIHNCGTCQNGQGAQMDIWKMDTYDCAGNFICESIASGDQYSNINYWFVENTCSNQVSDLFIFNTGSVSVQEYQGNVWVIN